MKNTIKKILLSSTAIASVGTFIPLVASCGENYAKMEVAEPESKSITGDSDKGTIKYQFKQTDTTNYMETQVKLVDLYVHDKKVDVDATIIDKICTSDGKIFVNFDTQKFISEYLAKYYDPTNGTPMPSRYKFEFVNEANKTKFTSSEFNLTITPAEYAIAYKAESEHVHFPLDATVKVYQQYTGQYHIDSKYKLSNPSILRYDGKQLLGQKGVVFAEGTITIPGEYVTGPITISANAEYAVCDVNGYGEHVTFAFNKQYVNPGEDVDGTYTIESSYELKQAYVFIGYNQLTDGFTIADGKIHINGNKVTDEVSVIISTDTSKYYVIPTGEHVTYSNLPETPVDPSAQITGKYEIESGYVMDETNTFVSVGLTELPTSSYTIANGNITINADHGQGTVVIYIATKPDYKKYDVKATGDKIISFPKEIPQASEKQEYKLTYTAKYGSLKTIEVKVGTNVLTRNTDYKAENGIITIYPDKITDKVTITATGEPTNFGKINYDLDDRLELVTGSSTEAVYGTDIKCILHAQIGYWHITNYGCAVGGDETYTQYLQWDDNTKTLTLPGQYVRGSVKIWASIA